MRMPQNANEFIELQLRERLSVLGNEFKSDIMSFTGPLVFGVDDVVRKAIEEIHKNNKQADGQKSLTIIVTTPGGYIDVVHRIVDTIRHHYNHVDFVVPNYAFSAGTIMVMSGDAIHMDYYSRLGPIDPQIDSPKTGQPVPALGYLVQWERLLRKAKEGKLTVAETQLMIDGFDQAELYRWEQSRELSIDLLKKWLVKYKFKNWKTTETRGKKVTLAMRTQRAASIARELNRTEKWHTHGHGISAEVLRKDLKLKIDDFGANKERSRIIRDYHNLLQDYMSKLGHTGVVHTTEHYLPFHQRR